LKGDKALNMSTFIKQGGNDGFALVEVVLVLVIVAGVLGAGAYVYSKHHKANTTASTSNTATTTASNQSVPLNGTTNSVQQLTQQEVQSETTVDSSIDAQNQQTVTNVNAAATNVGGAYNENTL
jgi:prepilin-type N-terminal cleavage/methylation domain-containing protein